VRRRAPLALLLAACGGRGGVSPRALDVSMDRATVVYADDTAVVQLRGEETRRVAIAPGTCLAARPDELFVLGDGWRAAVLGWRATGGSIHHHVSHELTVACLVDFRAGAARPLAELAQGLDIPDDPEAGLEIRQGPHTGYVYRFHWFPLTADVHDPKTGASAALDFELKGDYCDLVETPASIVAACARYEGPNDQTFFVEVIRLDGAAFPPKITGRLRIPVPRADEVRLSRDGSRVAYTAWVPKELGDEIFLGVHDTTSGAVLMERKTIGGSISSVDFSPPGDELLIAEKPASSRTRVTRHSLKGGEVRSWTYRDDPNHVFWLPDGRFLFHPFGPMTIEKL
jgi:hypothetical protein